MPEMNDPFYTTSEFLGIASGGRQVITDEKKSQSAILSFPCMCKYSASQAGIKNVNHVV